MRCRATLSPTWPEPVFSFFSGSPLTRVRSCETCFNLGRRLFCKIYLDRYRALDSNPTMDAVRRSMIPVAAARLSERIPGEAAQLLRLVGRSLSERGH